MIESVTLENFLSFKDSTTISFKATSEKPRKGYEHLSWVSVLNRRKLLKAVFPFGSNGSGKSNFMRALDVLRRMVSGEGISGEGGFVQSRLMQPFGLAGDCTEKPACISITFHTGSTRYTYTMKGNGQYICFEELLKYTSRERNILVYRKEDGATCFGPHLGIPTEAIYLMMRMATPRCTVMHAAAMACINIPDIDAARQYLMNIRCINGLEYGRCDLCRMLTECRYPELKHNMLVSMLAGVGADVVDYRIEDVKLTGIPDMGAIADAMYGKKMFGNLNQFRHLLFAHRNTGGHGPDGKHYIWTGEDYVSAGTRNAICLMAALAEAAINDEVVVIDECAAGISQELFFRIIQCYLSVSSGSQAILSTQMLPVLDMDGFRRDSARFFSKNSDTGATNVEDVDLRKFHANKNLYKNYTEHAFGGGLDAPDGSEWRNCLSSLRKTSGR